MRRLRIDEDGDYIEERAPTQALKKAKGTSDFGSNIVITASKVNELLTMHGTRVETANNGEEALAMIGPDKFDVILLDCQVPVMDGYETTRRIRAQEEYRTIPIIAKTGNAIAGDREEALAAGDERSYLQTVGHRGDVPDPGQMDCPGLTRPRREKTQRSSRM